MKSTLTKIDFNEPTPGNPVLFKTIFKRPDVGWVVLFTSINEGTVVWAEENAPYKVGHAGDTWVECTDADSWEPLPAGVEVRLAN